MLVLFVVLFGGKRLPEFARTLGSAVAEFRKALNEAERESSRGKGKELAG